MIDILQATYESFMEILFCRVEFQPFAPLSKSVIGLPMLQIMAWRRTSKKPLSQPMMT